MRIERVGTGAGRREWPDRPNVVRAFLGSREATVHESADEVLLEANLDDLPPEHLALAVEALFAAGAIDAWSTPAVMKKGRPGAVLSALARTDQAEGLTRVFFEHTSTLGVRKTACTRARLPRREELVATRFGEVRVKVATRPSGRETAKPELEDCAAHAKACGVSALEVSEAALEAWRQRST